MWRLANSQKQPGVLGNVKNFLDAPAKIAAFEVEIPMDPKDAEAAGAVGGLVSGGVRSMELWWDGTQKKLKVVIAAGANNIEPYKQAFSIMYPDAQFNKLKNTVPDWWDERYPYHYFDVSWRHGHFAGTVMDAKWFTTHLASAIQINQYAWVQAVWCTKDLSANMMSYANAFENAKEPNKENKEFTGNAPVIGKDIQSKTQGPHVILSVRGLCDFGAAEFDADYSKRSVHAIGGRSMDNIRDIPDDEMYSASDAAESGNYTIADVTDGIGILPFQGVMSAYDYLVKNRYSPRLMWDHSDGDNVNTISVAGKNVDEQRATMFPSRLIPDPSETLGKAISHYTMPNLRGNYRERSALPYMILKPQELITFTRLPSSNTKNVATTRGHALPSQQSFSKGYNMGFYQPTTQDMSGEEYNAMFGRPVVSADENAFVVSETDFKTHIYVPGATGSGKSSINKCFAKHMEMGNIYANMPRNVPVSELRAKNYKHLHGLDGKKTLDDLGIGYQNAFIYFDPKGDDSEHFIRMCETESVRAGNVRYLDPLDTLFAMNPLELPSYDEDSRDNMVLLYVGHFIDMVQAWYGDSDTFVRLRRILRVIVQYLYQNHDDPTLVDIYNIVRKLQEDGNYLKVICNDMGTPTPEIKTALESIALLKKEAFDPLITRLEPFGTDPILIRTFGVRRSTVSINDLIRPGAYTIVRFSKATLSQQFINIAMQTFVLHLWYAIQNRSAMTAESDRTQVILALDEFQNMEGVNILDTMIEEARSKGLGLILSHQNLHQLDDNMLSKILGNFGVQMAGTLEGSDAARIGSGWDPKFGNQLKEQIATQPKYRWTARGSSPPGKERPLPVQFWTHLDPKSGAVYRNNMSVEEWKAFCAAERAKYVPDSNNISMADKMSNMWMVNSSVEFLPRNEWVILLLLLRETQCKLNKITFMFGGDIHRDDVSVICKKMVENGLLEQNDTLFSIPDDVIKMWFTMDAGVIGKSSTMQRCIVKEKHNIDTCVACDTRSNLEECMERCTLYHLSKNHFIALANQDLAKDKNRTDLVGYDYDERQSISIEIESVSEADSHPQQVVKNMLKWEELHLDRCEIWSFNKKIFQIYDDLMEMEQEKKKHGEKNRVDTLNKVTIHVLNRMNNASRKQGTKSNTENEPGNGSENEAEKEAEGENESGSEAGSEKELEESGNENESESDGGLEKELKKEKSEKDQRMKTNQ